MADKANKSSWLEWLSAAEDRFDALRLNLKARLITNREPVIQPYIGHANGDKLFMRGRVLFGTKVKPASETDSVWQNFKNTYHRFESDEIRYATVRASVQGAEQVVRCDEEGFFRVELDTPNEPLGEGFWQAVHLELVDTPISQINTDNTSALGRIIVPSHQAQFAVVSDLDDTIMQTNVLSVTKMLLNTMFKNAYTRIAFDGVAAFYQALHNGTNGAQNPLFYVSSSPWNLYDTILDFYNIRGIPLGPIYLRNIGLTGSTFGGDDHMGHKLAFIQRLMNRHPQLPFILIGDSGQQDPHIYAEAVRRNPGRVAAIYIRDVRRPEHAATVRKIAIEMQEHNVDMLLIEDTLQAAEHAAANGFITAAGLANVQAAMNETASPMT